MYQRITHRRWGWNGESKSAWYKRGLERSVETTLHRKIRFLRKCIYTVSSGKPVVL